MTLDQREKQECEQEEKMRALSEKNGWTFIGISGFTNSGKSTCAKRITQTTGLRGESVHQDEYFRSLEDPVHVWVELHPSGRYQNWELLISINWDALVDRVCEIISRPAPGGSAFLIVEGHLVLNFRPFTHLCVVKFMITLEDEIALARRLKRADQPDPPGYFEQWVVPMFWKNYSQAMILNTRPSIITINATNLSLDELFAKIHVAIQPHLQAPSVTEE